MRNYVVSCLMVIFIPVVSVVVAAWLGIAAADVADIQQSVVD